MKNKILCTLAIACFQFASIGNVVANDVVKVGTEAIYPPFQYIGEKGEILGIEPDVLNAIGKSQDLSIETFNRPRKTWAKTLTDGEIDVWASAFYQGPQWAEAADMTKPFMEAYVTVVFLENDGTKNIHSIEDLQGRKIAVSKYYGQPMVDLAARLAGSPDNVVVLDTFYLSIRALYAGKADAVLGANYVLAYYIKQMQDTRGLKARFLLVPDQAPRQLVFLVKKGNTALLDKLNKGIDIALADGTIKKLQEEWLSAWQAVK